MKTENIIFLVWAVIFILILCQLFYFGPKKRRYLNTYIEVLDGDVLSYECQNTGVVIDTKKNTVRIFNTYKDSTFKYDNIREINYTLSEAGKIYSTSNNLNSMIKSAGANSNEQMLANQRSGIFILTDDIKNPSWKINLPMKNKTSSTNQEICDRWLLIFKKYVL
ncbi:TPA: DUF4755 domain-containing protein [Escherichia coli]|uniref:DUF4755 domain-containing protein n=1 Tax=Escherichia coli TaxID=562 RepID=A0A403D5N5_ECOLX|nr:MULTISPECIES: DUF4755 domain-containing protein [Enterobacteriaceae]ELJ0538579.1 DUF4755 domain-containing protein [Escherichia coli O36]MDJ8541270.1 DUF4755 domain-containing protein [Salmonella enterica]EEV5548910.1 DUF4755 domain-containing protein [Escherichia coli]EFC2153488.1 DUF4755 domain-containing protein [Escherichia coli]EFD1936149.1 DUF4755 domain-containing protein [Escherichia coli]